MNTRRIATVAARGLVGLLYPRACAACHEPIAAGDDALCAPCAGKLAAHVGGEYCGLCLREVGPHLLREGRCPACVNKLPRYERVVRVGRYGTVLRDMILRFKYGHTPTLDALLGDWMADAAQSIPRVNEIDAWAPVPSPMWRVWQRQYQPTRLLADRIARRTNRPRWDALKLTRAIEQQKRLPESSRAANVSGAFAARNRFKLAGKDVGLVDDVFTTGATLRACARALHDAGAHRVVAVVLAVARPGEDAVV